MALEGVDSDPIPTPRSLTDALLPKNLLSDTPEPPSGGKKEGGGGPLGRLLSRLRLRVLGFRGGGKGEGVRLQGAKCGISIAAPPPYKAGVSRSDHQSPSPSKREEAEGLSGVLSSLPPCPCPLGPIPTREQEADEETKGASDPINPRDERIGEEGRRDAICREIFSDVTGVIDLRLLSRVTPPPPPPPQPVASSSYLPPSAAPPPLSSSPPDADGCEDQYYYEMLSSYYERYREEGALVASLCQVGLSWYDELSFLVMNLS